MKILATVLAATALVGALGLGVKWVHDRATDQERARWTVELGKQKAQAKTELDAALADKKAAETALAAFQAQQKEKDNAAQLTIAGLDRKLAAAGRLRDPNATGCRPSGPPTTSPDPARASAGDGDGTQTDGLLSVQLSELLRARLLEADTINAAYASCRADTRELRRILNGLQAQ